MKTSMRRWFAIGIEPLFLLCIFLVSQLPMRDPDIWFHLKAGEYIANHGIPSTDPFSFAAAGRAWIPFEWLFQLVMHELSRLGMWTLVPFVSIFTTLMFFMFLRLLTRVLHVPKSIALIASTTFFVSIYEFSTPRPHMLAYCFVMITLYCIHLFLNKKIHRLWMLPFLTIIWSNIHSTGFLSWGLLLTYAVIALLQNGFTKTTQQLCIYAFLCAIATVLPPLWLKDYELLWTFFINREFLGHFIVEWSPITQDMFLGFYLYTGCAVLALVSLIATCMHTRRIRAHLWTLPFLVMILMGFTATRNVPLGMLGSITLLAWASGYFFSLKKTGVTRGIWILLGVCIIAGNGWLLRAKIINYATQRLNYPVAAAQFAKKYLRGRMFNDYNYGGYLLYHVTPTLPVFIDGRAEVYQCCEMRDYLMLAINKRMPDDQFAQFLDTFLAGYAFDFVMIAPSKHNVMWRIAAILSTHPQWALVFWDDFTEIFVKRNGTNDVIIAKLEAKAARPYLRDPYEKGSEERALFEYNRMDAIVKSARTSNAIGFLAAKRGDRNEAQKRFEEAVALDPTFESAYMNLAELAAQDGDLPAALTYYAKAQRLAPDRGLIYVRLGELTFQKNHDLSEAKAIWQQGFDKTVDSEARETLTRLLAREQ